jgi:phosphoglycolate phosphatase-like HAD superfamily hydrolase
VKHLTAGAAAFVEWLLASRLTVVVATSAKEDEVTALLTTCGGQALVKDATTSDDAERSKPDPDILVAALEKPGASPDRAIMIGDTPYDIEAARRAGLATIALRCGGWDGANLQGSIAIYDDPRQLLDRLANRRSISEQFSRRPRHRRGDPGRAWVHLATSQATGCRATGSALTRHYFVQAETS